LEKDFIELRQKMLQESKTVTNMSKEMSDDYKRRIQEIYEDTGKFVSQFTISQNQFKEHFD